MAEHMSWHWIEPNLDGKMRHPWDGNVWKVFDAEFPNFFNDPRNVKLGLTSNGFNSFCVCMQAYNIWPIVGIPYNLSVTLDVYETNLIYFIYNHYRQKGTG